MKCDVINEMNFSSPLGRRKSAADRKYERGLSMNYEYMTECV